ncbi:FAR1 DNA binding domain - like 10, partial [Theobroma cacao]
NTNCTKEPPPTPSSTAHASICKHKKATVPTCQLTESIDLRNVCKPKCETRIFLSQRQLGGCDSGPPPRFFLTSPIPLSDSSLAKVFECSFKFVFQMEEVCLNSEPVFDEVDEYEGEGDCSVVGHDDETGAKLSKKEPLPPTVGLEFDSFDEAYDFYNVFAKEQGFGIRVSNSWFRSKRKERYRAKLSCSSAGFKKKSEANNPRPETRTGCPAMVVIKLVDSKRWRIVEVELDHNHQVSPQIKRFYKSHKKMILAASMAQPPAEPVTEIHTIKMYRTAALDAGSNVEFETSWAEVIKQHGLGDNKWLQTLYEDRKQWVPVYLKDTFFAGTIPIQENESLNAFFDGYVHKHTSFKEFVDKYDLALHRKHLKEAVADMQSRNSCFELKTRCNFEVQLSKVYTKEIFNKFQSEVEGMYSCFNTRQVSVNGPIITYIVKERVETEGNEKEVRNYEVLFETSQVDIRCICSLFNYKGYLCRHALNVLNYNGVEEIPSRYILPRWCKDFKYRHVDRGSCDIDVYNPVYWHNHLHKCAIPVVEGGAQSQEHYKIALHELQELLNRFNLVEDSLV